MYVENNFIFFLILLIIKVVIVVLLDVIFYFEKYELDLKGSIFYILNCYCFKCLYMYYLVK